MIVRHALHSTARELEAGAVDEAYLEAEVMLMHVLGLGRAALYTRLEETLGPDYERELAQLIQRRLAHEPLAYITGRREFFGLDFHVAPGALIPRPETELLVEQALDIVERHFPRRDPVMADIGTGSGVIAITLARLLPRARIYATDISPQALEIAAVNSKRHGVQVELLEGDLLAPLPEPVDIIVANLPYVTDDELSRLSPEIICYEPKVALAGGRDGLDRVRQLIVDAPSKLRPGGVALLEIGTGQGQGLVSWVKTLFAEAEVELIPEISCAGRVLKLVLTKRLVHV